MIWFFFFFFWICVSFFVIIKIVIINDDYSLKGWLKGGKENVPLSVTTLVHKYVCLMVDSWYHYHRLKEDMTSREHAEMRESKEEDILLPTVCFKDTLPWNTALLVIVAILFTRARSQHRVHLRGHGSNPCLNTRCDHGLVLCVHSPSLCKDDSVFPRTPSQKSLPRSYFGDC